MGIMPMNDGNLTNRDLAIALTLILLAGMVTIDRVTKYGVAFLFDEMVCAAALAGSFCLAYFRRIIKSRGAPVLGWYHSYHWAEPEHVGSRVLYGTELATKENWTLIIVGPIVFSCVGLLVAVFNEPF